MNEGIELLKLRFFEYFEYLDYLIAPNRPLRTDDPTLFFINATVTPYKQNMLRGEYIPKTAHIQDCFRAKLDTDFLYYFEMLGIVSMSSTLDTVFQDFVNYLTECCRFPLQQLLIIVHQDDIKLQNSWLKICPNVDSMWMISRGTEKYKVRWTYGENLPLIGRGLTITYHDVDQPVCSPECNPLCSCTKYLPMGNVILIENGLNGSEYIDIGFGVEFLNGVRYGGDLFKLKEFKPIINSIINEGFYHSDAKRIFNLMRGIVKLINEGCVPDRKKEGYILRTMIRRIVDVILKYYPVHQVYAQIVLIYELTSLEMLESRIIITEEVNKYLTSIENGIKKAEKWISADRMTKNDEIHAKLRDTFGLPDIIISQLIKKKNQV